MAVERERWSPLYFSGFAGEGWQGFQLDLGADVCEHARWIASDEPTSDDNKRPVDERQLPLPGVRADSRARSIVFRALRLIGEVLPRGERGVGAARLLASSPLPRAWDRRVLNIEGEAWRFMERLVKSADLHVVWTEDTMRTALLRMHEVCPELVVRVNRREYLIPFGDLRDPLSKRLAALELWCREVEVMLQGREVEARAHDITTAGLRRLAARLRPGLRGTTCAPAFPRSPLVTAGQAQEAAAAALAKLGGAAEGTRNSRAFVACCVGDDFGLAPEEFRPLIEEWNATECRPPLPEQELKKILASARRNRKEPVGYRLSDTPATVAPPVGPASNPATTIWDHAVTLDHRDAGLVGPAVRWAERRLLDAEVLYRADLVRVLPLRRCPPACRINRSSWVELGYRLVLPVYDVHGELADVRARQIDGAAAASSKTGEAPVPGAKELMPVGRSARGLCFADAAGRALLAGVGEAPEELWIAEGGPDWATFAAPCMPLNWAPARRALWGVFAGSWTTEHAARVPPGTRVVIATDPGKAGDAYARRIAATLPDHEVLRLVLPDGMDVNEAYRAGRLDLTALTPWRLTPAAAAPAEVETVVSGSMWDRRALELLARWSFSYTGPARELARTLLLCVGGSTPFGGDAPPGAVRGLERALLRLRERGQLPERFTIRNEDSNEGSNACNRATATDLR